MRGGYWRIMLVVQVEILAQAPINLIPCEQCSTATITAVAVYVS